MKGPTEGQAGGYLMTQMEVPIEFAMNFTWVWMCDLAYSSLQHPHTLLEPGSVVFDSFDIDVLCLNMVNPPEIHMLD